MHASTLAQVKPIADTTVATLAQLRLSSPELAALAQQGFVTAERRGRATTIFKLRFRIAGRQQVRYLGTDPLYAAAVQQAVREQQHARHHHAELQALARDAGRQLRDAKRRLTGPLLNVGFTFHGHAVRQSRRGTDVPERSNLPQLSSNCA